MPSAIVPAPCREARGLHADDLQVRLDVPRRGGDAADQPAAAHRDHQRVQLRLRLQHLDGDRALAGDDQRVVERVHEGQALFLGHLERMFTRLVEGLAMQQHLGAESQRAFDLHGGRVQRHHDHRAHRQPLRMMRHALRVVAGRSGDHALHTGSRQGQQLVQRTAFLERRGELQVLELQEDLRADDLAQRLALDAWRVQHLTRQTTGGRLHVGKRHRRRHAVPPTVSLSMRSVGCPTPTGTLWPSLPQTPTPVSSSRSLPIMLTRVIASGPLPMMVAPFTG
jgi:hypothetical protein